MGKVTGLDRLDPENRRRVERLLARRPARLAALDAHGVRWPQTFAQIGPVMDNAFAEVRDMVAAERTREERPMLIDYKRLRDDDGEDHDRAEAPCTCGATIVVQGTRPGPGFAWRITHGDGEAAMAIGGLSDDHLLWMLGMRDPIARWVERVHAHEGLNTLAMQATQETNR